MSRKEKDLGNTSRKKFSQNSGCKIVIYRLTFKKDVRMISLKFHEKSDLKIKKSDYRISCQCIYLKLQFL